MADMQLQGFYNGINFQGMGTGQASGGQQGQGQAQGTPANQLQMRQAAAAAAQLQQFGDLSQGPSLQRTNSDGMQTMFSGAQNTSNVGQVVFKATPQWDAGNFPALGSGVGSWSNNASTAVLGSPNKEFAMASEDFPALPGSGMGGAGGQQQQKQGDVGQVPFVNHAAAAAAAAAAVAGGGGDDLASGKSLEAKQNDEIWQAQLAANKVASEGPAKGDKSLGAGVKGVHSGSKYGLMGLLDVILHTERDLNALMLGSDLTTYGLNLNSSDCLFPSFPSPFADQVSSNEPKFATPKCYNMPIPPSVKIEHMAKFQLETLFYKFYALPGDVLQALAAQELYRREWRYHGELKLWMKQRSPQEVMSAADGTPPTIAFIFFDPATWEARPFNTAYRGNLTAGFLKDEDLKVSPADLKIQKS